MSSRSKKNNEESPVANSWDQHRRIVHIGQAVMLAGVLVAASHWLAHLEAFGPGQPPGWLDLAAGYPMGATLLIVGGMLAGRRQT
ncbi:hypothetical protein [Salinibacterium sp. PAMC 21357]|uniref:hypothetical protein n=1 Tax=Salinibacterium sp. PAMC 21357 TaxID=1112215 RepID=UPI00028940D3|nr:hypothetical protein [Salinibacterium sp. PAMC 21357]